ncbi:MAG: hypothetical protein ACPG5W_02970, partial [Flavobacteriales bacterium]
MNLINKSLLLLAFCLLSVAGFSQEMLFDLTSNLRLEKGAWEAAERRHNSNARATGDTLDLPFFDDFSEPFSRVNTPFDLYPNLDRWIGKTIYVNNHLAVNPPSQGVATFDGADENGQAYFFSNSVNPTPTLSDSLTSKPINLEGQSDVYFSFYYQAQGLGDEPEDEATLLLEFKDTAEAWIRVWDAEGYILEDNQFNRVTIPLSELEYLFNGFQFRFMNLSARTGSVDHWHIDYVELDAGRSENDTVNKDLAFLGQNFYVDDTQGIQFTSASLLAEYSSMPWEHFKLDPAEHMADSSFVSVRNNDTVNISSERFYIRVEDLDGNQLFENQESSPVIFASTVCGNRFNECNDQSFDQLRGSLEDYVLPTSPELTQDSSYFVVKNVLLDAVDNVPENDTSVYVQKFYNYYSYDDGTAEEAYGLGDLESAAYVALRYDVKMEDDLQSIQIYSVPAPNDIADIPIKLMVWTGTTEPETVVYESSDFVSPSFSSGVNYFYNYMLEAPLTVGVGTIFIGYKQEPVSTAGAGVFTVGFDKRTDNSERLFYNLGSSWNQSSIPGSVMMRPTFGQPFDWVSGVDENLIESLSVYPNP